MCVIEHGVDMQLSFVSGGGGGEGGGFEKGKYNIQLLEISDKCGAP